MTTREALWAMSRAELYGVLRTGHAIAPSDLDDTEYRGTSLGLGGLVERLTWKTFVKTFHRDPATLVLRGWNVRLEQTGQDGPPVPRTKGGVPITFGHYHVVPLAGRETPAPCGEGLLIDYGVGGNGRLDPMASMRDPIVAVNAGQHDLLLGWSYVEIGSLRLRTPSFFTLERVGPLSYVVEAPARS